MINRLEDSSIREGAKTLGIECKVTECLSCVRTKESPALVRESASHSCPDSDAVLLKLKIPEAFGVRR